MNTSNNYTPLVTVAIPTYNRKKFLCRALHSVFLQTYSNLEVIVSDNCSESYNFDDVIQKFQSKFKNCKFIRQTTNIGPINNFMYCLNIANGDYFMWLADDDEIAGCEYINSLVNLINSDSEIVTAAPKWKKMISPHVGTIQPAREYKSSYWFVRAYKFMLFAKDDFFYALHKTSSLKNAKFVYFGWINKNSVFNLTYPYLFDMAIQGKIVYINSDDAIWVNHGYTDKSYSAQKNKFLFAISYVTRRINLHYIYISKLYHKNFLVFFFAPLFSFVSLFADYFIFFGKIGFRKFNAFSKNIFK